MANFFKDLIMTNQGINLVLRAMAGECRITLTKMATSTSYYDNSAIPNLTSIPVVQSRNISSIKKVSAGTIQIKGAVDNNGVDNSYTVHALGLYAKPSDGPEILYAVASGKIGAFITEFDGYSATGLNYNFLINIGNSDKVNLTVDSSATVSVNDLADTNNHVDIIENILMARSFTVPLCASDNDGLLITDDGYLLVADIENKNEIAKDYDQAINDIKEVNFEQTNQINNLKKDTTVSSRKVDIIENILDENEISKILLASSYTALTDDDGNLIVADATLIDNQTINDYKDSIDDLNEASYEHAEHISKIEKATDASSRRIDIIENILTSNEINQIMLASDFTAFTDDDGSLLVSDKKISNENKTDYLSIINTLTNHISIMDRTIRDLSDKIVVLNRKLINLGG